MAVKGFTVNAYQKFRTQAVEGSTSQCTLLLSLGSAPFHTCSSS